jgi:lipopolysaccharide transport system ATP-binding protein
MNEIVIRTEQLGKRYRLGARLGHRSLRETLSESLRPHRWFRRSTAEQFWALKDVNLEVGRGEALGLIGRNGAGKTTLLKILSRITRPTTGVAEIRGRVGSLLEVGTGFHPELTGRENIYLSGAILGMAKNEIDRKFDEIVAFAEIDQFLDTAVKHYSSGMFVRLAFAVAAHLEPEILLVDEVLAVGDAAFQKKCLGKMGDVARGGRTVVFVSHNMAAIGHLCARGIWLQDGSVQVDGDSREVIAAYLRETVVTQAERRWDEASTAPGDDLVRLRAVRILSNDGELSASIYFDESFRVQLEYTIARPTGNLWFGVHITTLDGISILSTVHPHRDDERYREFPARYVSECVVPGRVLNCGQFGLRVASEIPQERTPFVEENVLSFQIFCAENTIAGYNGRVPGLICMPVEWRTLNLQGATHEPSRA